MRAGIALGANIGERLENLRAAKDKILSLPEVRGPALSSPVYETEPVDGEPDAPSYLNAVIEIDYEGDAVSLLDKLSQIEKELGRPSRRPRNAPRLIDLDLLYLDDLVIDDVQISVPHPRLHLRRFVLSPLCDIRPELILPGCEEPVSNLLEKLPASPAVKLFAERL